MGVLSFATVVLLTFGASPQANQLRQLERSLNAALPDIYWPIVLKQSDNFRARPGTVIFLSRSEGAARMIAYARANTNEFSLLFLPRWNAWITETIEWNKATFTVADTRFCEMAVASEPEVELWHFHNNIGLPKTASPWVRRGIQLEWTVPSRLDLAELYGYMKAKPKARVRGFVASAYGVMSYEFRRMPTGASDEQAASLLEAESLDMRVKARKAGPSGLKAMATRHRGIFRLRFQPVP